MEVSITLFFDTRRMKNDGTYPVKLNIYFEDEKRRYKTGFSLTESDWEKIIATNLRDDDLRTIKRKLNIKKEKAEKITEKMESFSFEEFEKIYLKDKKVQSINLKDIFDEYIQSLEKKGRIGSAGQVLLM